MEDAILAPIIYVTPGAIIVSVVCLILVLLVRKTTALRPVRAISLGLTLISFLAALSLVFLLLAHPYMNYALMGAGVSFLALIIIYFLKEEK